MGVPAWQVKLSVHAPRLAAPWGKDPAVEGNQVLGPQSEQPTCAALCSELTGFKWG